MARPQETFNKKELEKKRQKKKKDKIEKQEQRKLADTALAQFHQQFAHEPLVIDKWFMLQARAPERDGKVFERARKLAQHLDFTLKNPNRARSLLVQLCNLNPGAFHRADAGGYVFWAEQVAAIDALNPQLAGRLARAMDRWAVLAEPYRAAA